MIIQNKGYAPHRGLPWACAVSAQSVSGDSGASSYTRISSSYSSITSSNSWSPMITISANSFSLLDPG